MKQCHNKNHKEDSLYCIFCEILDSVLDVFGLDEDCPKEVDQNGELMVTGEGEIDIELKSLPKRIKLHFKESCTLVPCNPNHFDELEWEITSDCNDGGHEHCHKHHDHKAQFVLHVKWNVSDVKDITWKVSY